LEKKEKPTKRAESHPCEKFIESKSSGQFVAFTGKVKVMVKLCVGAGLETVSSIARDHSFI
jgi:hypothetical protein